MTNFFVLVFSRQNYDKNSWTRVVGQASHTWSSICLYQFLPSSFSFYFDGGFWRFLFLFFCAPNFTHSTKIMIKFVKSHGQNSLLYLKSFSLLFIITKKKSFDIPDRKSIVLNLMNILTILQIIDPLTYTLWLELSNFVHKL